MGVEKTRDSDGFLRPVAHCDYGPCQTPPQPMTHDDRYTKVTDPGTGLWALAPEGVMLPVGWTRWYSGEGEEIMLCQACGTSLRPVFGLPTRE